MGWGGSASHYAQYDGVYLGTGSGDTLIYLVYANGTGNAHNLSVYVDGVNKGTITVQNTGGWGNTERFRDKRFRDTILISLDRRPGMLYPADYGTHCTGGGA